MGQRMQTYIKIANPAKFLYDRAEKIKAIKLFGNGEHAILVYHNQWLYGKSSLETALRLLDFSSELTKENKTTKNDGYNVPLCPNGMESVEDIVKKIEFILNYRPTKDNARGSVGFDNAFFINETDEGIREDYRNGDNNDGIIIIDAIENKYCFMNINEYSGKKSKELYHSASDLPYLKPVSALEYVRAYYGETVKKCNPYHFDGEDKKVVLKEHKKENKKISNRFSKYELLTETEIDVMFPKVKQTELKS